MFNNKRTPSLILSLFLLLLLSISVTSSDLYAAQGSHLLWSKEVTASGFRSSLAVDHLGNIIIGVSWSDGGPLVIKTDRNGNQLWKFLLSQETTVDWDTVCGVAVDSENSIIALWKGTIVKIDANGNQVWKIETNKQLANVTVDQGDNIIAVGSVDGSSFFTMKIHSDGSLVWGKDERYGWYPGESAFGVTTDSQNNIIVAGWAVRHEHKYEAITEKIDAGGAVLWTRFYPDECDKPNKDNVCSDSSAHDVTMTSDGDILVIGRTHVNGLAIKYSPEGRLVKHRTYEDGTSLGAAAPGIGKGDAYIGGVMFTEPYGAIIGNIMHNLNLAWEEYYADFYYINAITTVEDGVVATGVYLHRDGPIINWYYGGIFLAKYAY